MKLTLKEMNGLLNGKCLPSDLIVGETLAEYLVRKFTELEQQLAESHRALRAETTAHENVQMQLEKMAEENAGLKESRAILVKNTLETCNEIASAGFRHEAIMRGLYESTGNRNKYPKPITTLVDEALRKLETPATDAFLDEVRAQGVDMMVEQCESDIMLIEPEDEEFYTLMIEHDKDFASELRKGVQS